MATPNFHIAIDYDEGDQASYRGVVLTLPGGREFTYYTRSPDVDYLRAQQVAYAGQIKHPGFRTLLSSSVDHFVMDGERFRWTDDEMIEEVVSAPETPYRDLTQDQQYTVADMRAVMQHSRAVAYRRLQADPSVKALFEQFDDQYRAYSARFGLPIEKLHDDLAHSMWRVAQGQPDFVFCAGRDFPELAIMAKPAPRDSVSTDHAGGGYDGISC
ncbi:hypothetical protein BAMBUS_01550 [Brevundimonas phage vB_BpoS-Bambus]|nr:hypothetical protein BAMBUS_01550 [Brevundimonas phage vB_BpoS-Bambus]